jgi:hypothetical protein
MIKKVLKGIFPRTFLKKAFLVYNQIKAATWDRVFFKKATIEDEYFLVNEKKNPFLELNIDVTHFDKSVQDKLTIWTNPQWNQDQYLVRYSKPGYIDPHVGWAITSDRRLIHLSLGFASAPHVHKPDWFETYFIKPTIRKLDKVISLRDTGEENYFHFFNDVIAKIYFLKDYNIDLAEYSIVISGKLYAKPYFQYFLENTFLKVLNWHAQKADEWISFESALFCKPYTHTKKYFDISVRWALNNAESPAEKKLFLTRSSTSLRYIENMQELSPILHRFNFETIDTSQIEFEQQIRLFRECRYLIAVHGAGITNAIFRSGYSMSLLEIVQPSSYIPFHYIMLCKMYGYDYDIMTGSKGTFSGSGGFEVNPIELETKIQIMLSR